MKISLLGKRMLVTVAGALGLLMCSAGAFAADAAKIDTGDTAWVLASTALVLLMTPGLALFYAGMVRRKNVLGTMLQSFIMMALGGVLWVLYGYSLAFGTDHGHVIGSLGWLGLNGVGLTPNADYAATIPHQAFMIFQAMFAVITPALISGAIADRMRFKAYFAFVIVWFTLVYCPVAHWVWGIDGWIRNMGALDFAGGTVVHISSGISALVAAIVIGRRKGYGREEFKPHNLTMTLIGTGLLWFGWFGFNAGSALGANGLAVNAFVTTNTAAAMATIVWVLIEWFHHGKPTALGAASGAVAGLVAITPACGFVGPMAAIAIGAMVSIVSYSAIMLKGKLGYDDSLDVFGVHCVGGTLGAIATGLFASVAINSAGANGLFHGNAGLLWIQIKAVVAVLAYASILTFVILKVIGIFTPLRMDKEEEETGMDLSQHGEIGYNL